MTRPIADRFWKFVDKKSNDDCWNWTGGKMGNGYGSLRVSNKQGSHVYAHRLSWELHNGPIPKGMQVLHHCDNPSCVNPNHLFIGTASDNMRDMDSKNRRGNRNYACGDRNGLRLHPEKCARGDRNGMRIHPEKRHHFCGEKNGMAKLTKLDIEKIKQMKSNGISQKEISINFRVSQANISLIVNNKRWQEV